MLQPGLRRFNGDENEMRKMRYEMAAKKFMYTQNENNVLSISQREFYEENGYLLIPKLVDGDLLDECRQRFVDLCNDKFERGFITVMKEKSLMGKNVKGEYLINKVQDISFDKIFSKYVTHEPILDVIEGIIGSEIMAINSMLINKPPNANPDCSRHPLHQDLHYFPLRPAEKIVASWTAMEKVDVNNGCLYVSPGTHRTYSLQPHDYPRNMKNAAYHEVLGVNENIKKVALEMEKCDTVFFHPLLLHGSGPNITEKFRKAISVHYASSHCHFIDTKGTSQEKIAQEITHFAKTKGLKINIVHAFKLKSVCVRGGLGNFKGTSKI